MPQTLEITSEQIARIRAVPHFARHGYRDLDIARTLEFYKKRYVDQLAKVRAIDAATVIADIGTGYGWLAMTLALLTPAKVIAIEMDAERLAAGREIASILGVADRIEWRAEPLGGIGLPDRSIDIVYCIEVLEHVRASRAALADLARLSRDVLIVTTPNKWFPVIAHDTRLPFCHMLPLPARQVYARAMKRTDCENDNIFLSPLMLRRALADYRPVSGFLHYASLDDYLATYPFYLPYLGAGGGEQRSVGRAKLAWYRLASRLGRNSAFVMPNLAGVYRLKSRTRTA